MINEPMEHNPVTNTLASGSPTQISFGITITDNIKRQVRY